MHIIIGIIVALAGLLWAFKYLLEGASEARSAARRLQWHGRTHQSALADITDPREVGALILVELQRYEKSHLSADDSTHIAGLMQYQMDLPASETKELVAFAEYTLRDHRDIGDHLGKVLPAIKSNCTSEEIGTFVAMMRSVVRKGSEAEPAQTALVNRVCDRLGVS